MYRGFAAALCSAPNTLVFSPKDRSKTFLIPGLEERFRELMREICERSEYVLLALERDTDHCHIFANVPPTVSAADVVRVIKTNMARVLMREFDELRHMKNLWTRSCFASTAGKVAEATIKRYKEEQKTRG